MRTLLFLLSVSANAGMRVRPLDAGMRVRPLTSLPRVGPTRLLAGDEVSSRWAHVRWYRRQQQRRQDAKAARKAEVARLKLVYAAAQEGHVLSQTERVAIRAVSGGQADHYGEITPKGFAEVGLRMGLTGTDCFADLGSGTGKVVLQSVADFGCRSAVGVEFAESRHQVAAEALSKLPGNQNIVFRCADCAAADEWAPGGSLADASAVYISSVLFSDELMGRLGGRLAASSARVVATLRRFPGGLDGYSIERRRAVSHEMSWTASQDWPGVDRAAGDVYDPITGVPVHIYWKDEQRDA